MSLYRDSRDPAVFEALYAFARRGVEQWIASLLGRELLHLDPAEILQDTFVNVYRYPGAFREDHCGSFRVWVRTIAGNVVRRCSGARHRSAQLELLESPEPVDRSGGPIQTILEEDESQQLRRAWILLLCYYAQAWKELSQRDRRTLHLVEVEGLSYQEAGRVLSVRRSNMKMIVFRSRRRLARRMREAMGCAHASVAPELVA
jgi:RNA polymerase sigma factor (sigma-70 family)